MRGATCPTPQPARLPGGSLKALDALAEKTQCTIVGQAAVLAAGDASERKDIIFLEPLPLFFH